MYRYSLKIRGSASLLIAKFILYYTLFIGFFIYNFNVPESVLYVGDVFNIILIVLCFRNIAKAIREPPLRTYVMLIMGVCLSGIFSALLNGFDIALIFWSLRNWGRSITFFLACCCILNEKQSIKIVVFTKTLFHINSVVILFQYIFFKSRYNQDSLNGLFGRNTSSVNTIFLMVLLCIVLSEYFTRKTKIKELIIYLIEFNAVCVIAELRGLIVFEILFILFYAVINFKGTASQFFRYVALTLIVVIAASIAANYLARIYPRVADFFSIEGIIKSANNEQGYGFTGYIDRLNFYPVINKYLFNGSFSKLLFGIGMGNAEYSAVSRLCSPFYNAYGTTFGYLRFSASMIFLETGLVGLAMFFGSYIILLVYCIKKARSNRTDRDALIYQEIGAGVFATIILYLIYNNLQRTDASFIIAFYAAIPIAIGRKMISQ